MEAPVKKADIGVGIFLILFAGLVFVATEPYRAETIYIYGPHLFPRLCAAGLAILGSVLIINAFWGRVLSMTDRIDRQGFFRLLIALAMFAAYIKAMQVLGFVTTTFLFLFVLMTFLKQQGVLLRIASSLLATLIVYGLFRWFLVLPLPEGIFI